jgi:hypothetical protein
MVGFELLLDLAALFPPSPFELSYRVSLLRYIILCEKPDKPHQELLAASERRHLSLADGHHLQILRIVYENISDI